MKEYKQIIGELATNGYNWTPNYKDIDEKIWIKMEEYFNEDEVVMSALWCDYKDDLDIDRLGILFLTSSRTFMLDVEANGAASRVRYTPYNVLASKKIQTQYSKTSSGFNYVSLDFTGYGSMITFKTPNKSVAKHFVDNVLGLTSEIEYEELPESDNPLLADNKKEQLIDDELEKVKEQFDHNFKEKVEDEVKLDDHELWRKAPAENYEKEVEIKEVPLKEVNKTSIKKQKKKVSSEYASKMNSKIWLLWFLIPVGIIVMTLITIFFK